MSSMGRKGGLLANEEHIDGTQIEVVVERKRGETIVRGMLTGVELRSSLVQFKAMYEYPGPSLPSQSSPCTG